jgi:hypothetical protein
MLGVLTKSIDALELRIAVIPRALSAVLAFPARSPEVPLRRSPLKVLIG